MAQLIEYRYWLSVIPIAERGILRYFLIPIHLIPRDGFCPNLVARTKITSKATISIKGETLVFTAADPSLTEIALRFAIASILFQYEVEINAQSEAATIEALEQDFTNPWHHKLVLSLTPRLGTEDDLDLQGYSIIDVA
jgi:hypothetical protein